MMAYFPKAIMIDVEKADAPGFSGSSNSILAEDYYVLADEIMAIEKFLGINQATQADRANFLNSNPAAQNVLSVLSQLVADVNSLSGNGILTSSGYVHDQQRAIFPEGAWATFLASVPAPDDVSIGVFSTVGFPGSGVISILNDLNVSLTPIGISGTGTNVEWIRYNGTTPTQFLNCQRGYRGTTAGSHVGSYRMRQTNSSNLNMEDQCLFSPAIQGNPILQLWPAIATAGASVLCEFRYPTWRFNSEYSIPKTGLSGSLVEIAKQIADNPASIPLIDNNMIKAASICGILSYDNDGRTILKSADPAYSSIGQLAWSEAACFLANLQAFGLVTLVSGPSDWIVGGSPLIPVFAGTLSFSYSLNALTIDPAAQG